MRAAGERGERGLARLPGDAPGKRQAAGEFQHRARAVRTAGVRPAERLQLRCEARDIDGGAVGVQVQMPRRELGELAEAAGEAEPRHRPPAEIFEQRAREVAHVDHGVRRQAEQRLQRRFRAASGGRSDMVEAGGARHIHAAMDRMDPGRAGIGDDDARGAQHRKPAHDAQPFVGGLQRQRFAVPDADLDLDIGGKPVFVGDRAEIAGDDGAGTGIDGGLADGERQARQGDGADARPRAEPHARARRRGVQPGAHDGAVGGVRVVARVLLHADPLPGLGEREGGLEAARQVDGHRVRQASGDAALEGGACRRRRAGPRRPAPSKLRHASGL